MCARSPLRRRLTSIAFGVVSVAGLLVVSSDANAQLGSGTFFKITPSGTLTVLHAFNWSEGGYPVGGLAQATDGNFYGTTSSSSGGWGTVFKITPNGTLTVLHAFSYSSEGGHPMAGLVQATDGNFYGTTCPALVYPDPWLAEHEPIRHRVSVLLGRSEATFQTNFGVQIPAVLSKDGYLVLSGCRPHSCADERAAIFVSISLNVVHCVLIVDGRLSIFSEDSALLPQALVDSWRRKGF